MTASFSIKNNRRLNDVDIKVFYIHHIFFPRPFYVAAATPASKDVIVIIDRSGSMTNTHHGKTLLQIAKEAATSVVETLNPNDRVKLH